MNNKELINIIKQYPLDESGLKLYYEDLEDGFCIEPILIIDFANGEITTDEIDGLINIKPVLRPLSMLTEEIEHEGERFVPMDLLYQSSVIEIENSLFNEETSIAVYFKLLEWKFDVFELIEKGYAISTQDERLKGIKIY